jgi:hypothetical protein
MHIFTQINLPKQCVEVRRKYFNKVKIKFDILNHEKYFVLQTIGRVWIGITVPCTMYSVQYDNVHVLQL